MSTTFAQLLNQRPAFSSLNAPTPVVYSGGNTITLANHGLTAGSPISFSASTAAPAGTLPSPLVAGQTYYVEQVIDANNFTITAPVH